VIIKRIGQQKPHPETPETSAEVCPMHLACWFLFHGSYSLDFWALGLMQCFGVSFFKGGDGGVAPVAYENLGIFEFFFFFPASVPTGNCI